MTSVPLSKIQELQGQGLSNNQIIQQLEKQGFRSTDIFDALTAAKGGPPPLNSPPPQVAPMTGQPMPPQMPPPQMAPSGMGGGPDNEELIEAIIDEKWNDLMGDINKVIAWKESTETRITQLEQQLKDMKDQFDKLHQAVIGKVGEYDQHILDVGAEVKAMEKVFSKVLPIFTDNVAQLSHITENLSKKKKAPEEK